MKRNIYILSVVLLIFAKQIVFADLRMKEYFNYNVGDTLTDATHTVFQTNTYTGTSWNSLSGLDCPVPYTVTSGSMSYPGYVASGEGNKVQFTASGGTYSGLPFGDISSGNIYVSFLVKITSVGTAGSYFFCLGPNNLGNNLRDGVFAKIDANNKLAFGIGIKASSVNSWTGYNYDLGDTCLIVIKHQIKSGTGNDVVSLIVNPVAGSTEPDASLWVNPTASSTDIPLGSIILRRGTSSAGPTGYIGNIRVATSWADVMADPQPAINTSIDTFSDFKYTTHGGPSNEQYLYVSGTSLADNITITPSENYEISYISGMGFSNTPIVLYRVGGAVSSTPIYIQLKAGLPAGNYPGQLTLTSGSLQKTIACNGSVNPSVSTSVSTLTNFGYKEGQGPSAEKTFRVNGINLTGDAIVTPPENFEISIVSGSNFQSTPLTLSAVSGQISSKTVYVRLKAGLTAGSYSGNIVVESQGANAANVSVSGSVEPVNALKNIYDSNIKVVTIGNEIKISGMDEGKQIEVYNISGSKVVSITANKGDNVVKLGRGNIYILKLGNEYIHKVIL
jgi:hypothetical protein